MKKFFPLVFFFIVAVFLYSSPVFGQTGTVVSSDLSRLQAGFEKPPVESRLWSYWWILNGNVDKPAVERDLRQMKQQGFGGAIYFDANGSNQDGNRNVPAGPLFGSPQWRETFKHAVQTADELGMSISLNMLSGWNMGGRTVKPEDAAKLLCWSETVVESSKPVAITLPKGKVQNGFYRDVAVVAYPQKENDSAKKLDLYAIKTAQAEFGGSAPVCSPLMVQEPIVAGEENALLKDVVDISDKFNRENDTLTWTPPATAKKWVVLRFGFTLSGACTSTSSGAWTGLSLDHLSKKAFDNYWDENVVPILEDNRAFAGKTLRYIHTDSWELGGINWTDSFRDEFQSRRGYNITPYLPVVAGKIVENRQVSNQFLHDFRRTIGDLIRDNHYLQMKKRAAEWEIGIHPESGGPHGAPIDSLQLIGQSDIPMSEFWSWSPRHRVGEANRFFVKQPASAAHVFGHRFVAAEGFTNIGMHWNESWATNLKPSLDQAFCEGLNLLVWHAFTCSPESQGLPGQEYFAGTHFNPQALLWNDSADFLAYINRCQFLLQQGLPCSDVLEFYGDNVPNFTQYKKFNSAGSLPGYDFDTAPEEAILNRLSVRNGNLVLTDGTSYRLLVLPDRTCMSLQMAKKLQSIVQAGGSVLGPKPNRTSGVKSDSQLKEFNQIVDQLWGTAPDATAGKSIQIRKVGLGRVITGAASHAVLQADEVPLDFEFTFGNKKQSQARIEWIHRKVYSGQTIDPKRGFADFKPIQVNTIPSEGALQADVYYVANVSDIPVDLTAKFRAVNATVEFWNPLDGSICAAKGVKQQSQQTTVPISLSRFGSVFVVFNYNRPASTAQGNQAEYKPQSEKVIAEITTPWKLDFPGIKAFADKPIQIELKTLESWTRNADRNIKYYSGTAVYKNSVEISSETVKQTTDNPDKRILLSLTDVREIARVLVNGKDVGVVWAKPYCVDITSAVKPGINELEIRVSTNWNNRLVGDFNLPPSERKTRTNITRINQSSPLLESGLLGPVQIRLQDR